MNHNSEKIVHPQWNRLIVRTNLIYFIFVTSRLMENPVCSILHLSLQPTAKTCLIKTLPGGISQISIWATDCSHSFSCGFLLFRVPVFRWCIWSHCKTWKKTTTTPNNLSIQNYYFDANTFVSKLRYVMLAIVISTDL